MPKAKKKGGTPRPATSAAPSSHAEKNEFATAMLVTLRETNPLGAASKNDLLAVINDRLGADPDLEAPETAIAIESLARVIQKRLANSASHSDPDLLAVFILSDRPRDAAQKIQASREPTLNDGSRCLTGNLWIATPSFGSAYCVPFSATEPGQIFDEVEARGCGTTPALVFNPTATDAEIRYYPNGLTNEDKVLRFFIAEKVFTLDSLDKVLKRFHENNIITPDATVNDLNPWKDGKKYIPRERTEGFIQGLLKNVLTVAFFPCRIDHERQGTEGRCDLLISSKHPTDISTWIAHAALELKVLRSLSSGGQAVAATVCKEAIQRRSAPSHRV